ncbi:hypothetical protein [Roseateles sp. BYS96W]|uniref:Sel1 repeat family protein n=1 Tax=Pelomonas nitida TaxID=3299027 RepID=A0ABW7G9K1_9BURK
MGRKIALVTVFCLLANSSSAESPKQLGADAANSGRYSEAYWLWLPLAEGGDREVQEGVALLLAGNGDLGIKFSASERHAQTLKWLVKSARNGQPTAMRWLADSFKWGWYGLIANPAAARCWRSAAESDEATRLSECEKLADIDSALTKQ